MPITIKISFRSQGHLLDTFEKPPLLSNIFIAVYEAVIICVSVSCITLLSNLCLARLLMALTIPETLARSLEHALISSDVLQLRRLSEAASFNNLDGAKIDVRKRIEIENLKIYVDVRYTKQIKYIVLDIIDSILLLYVLGTANILFIDLSDSHLRMIQNLF